MVIVASSAPDHTTQSEIQKNKEEYRSVQHSDAHGAETREFSPRFFRRKGSRRRLWRSKSRDRLHPAKPFRIPDLFKTLVVDCCGIVEKVGSGNGKLRDKTKERRTSPTKV